MRTFANERYDYERNTMADLKTKPTAVSVDTFLGSLGNDKKRADALVVLEMMKKVTGEKPKMWGPSIIGFGEYHYVYESGHEGDMCLMGFSPRKASMTIYFWPGFEERFAAEFAKLGKYKASKACLYINKLADVDLDVLRDLIQKSYDEGIARTKPKKPAKPKK